MQEWREPRFGQPEPTIGELFNDLARETKILLRQEVQLAKIEMRHTVKHAGKGAGMIAAGGVLGFVGVMCITAMFIALLSTVMAVWVASLIVGVVVLVVAAILARSGMNEIRKTEVPPKEMVESVREDAIWLTKRR